MNGISKDSNNPQRESRRSFWFWAMTVVGALVLMILAPLGGYQLYLFRNSGNLALGNLTPAMQTVATYTPTPLPGIAAANAGVTTVPLDTQGTNPAEGAVPVEIAAIDTPAAEAAPGE